MPTSGAVFDSESIDAEARHLAEKHQLQADAAAASQQCETTAVRIAELEAQLRTAEEHARVLVMERTEAAAQIQDLRAGREQAKTRAALLVEKLKKRQASLAVAEHRLDDAAKGSAQLEGRAREQELTINALSDQAGELKGRIRYLEGKAENLTQARDNALNECEALRLLTGRQHQVLLAQGQALPFASVVPSS